MVVNHDRLQAALPQAGQQVFCSNREGYGEWWSRGALTGVDLRVFPKTPALQDQKLLSLEVFPRVWLDWLMRGYIVSQNWQIPIPTSAFCEAFREAALKIGHRSELSESAIGQKLRKLLPSDPKSRSSLPGRPYVYLFPPLAECRQHFCLVSGIPVDGPDENTEELGKAAAWKIADLVRLALRQRPSQNTDFNYQP